MNRPGLTLLSVLACASLTINAALWIAYRSAQEDRENLRLEMATLAIGRKAANAAGMVHDQLQQKALNDVQRKNLLLDQAVLDSHGIDDAAFLDALRRVLPKNTNCAGDAARKPALGLPDAAGAGDHDAIR